MNKKGLRMLFLAQSVDTRRGPDGFIADWVLEVASRVETLVVLTYFYSPSEKLPTNTKLILINGHNFLSRNVDLFVKTFRIVRQERINILFAHILEVFSIMAGAVGRLTGVKSFFWYCQPYDITGNYLARLGFVLVDRILTCSPKTKERYVAQTGTRATKIAVVGHGINLGHYEKGEKITWPNKGEEIKILYLGRVSPIKDIPTLERAADLLKQQGYMVSLKVVGGSGEKVAYADNPYVYKGANIFVNPSRSQALDKTLLEAFACGVPAIGSDEGYPFIKEKFPRLVFRAGDSVDLARKVSYLIDHPKERVQMAQSAKRFVVSKFSLEKLFSRISKEWC